MVLVFTQIPKYSITKNPYICSMDQKISLANRFKVESLWWIITLLIVFLVMFPIYRANPEFDYLWINIMFIVVFVTGTRYIFLLKYTPISHSFWPKVIYMAASVPIFLKLLDFLAEFNVLIDEKGAHSFFPMLATKAQLSLGKYLNTEFVFFGVGAILVAVIFAFRCLVSIWRMRNRGTV